MCEIDQRTRTCVDCGRDDKEIAFYGCPPPYAFHMPHLVNYSPERFLPAVTAHRTPQAHPGRDFHQIRSALINGETSYWPYASTASRAFGPEDVCHGTIKCAYCGTAYAVTIRGGNPLVSGSCPSCGAPLDEDP